MESSTARPTYPACAESPLVLPLSAVQIITLDPAGFLVWAERSLACEILDHSFCKLKLACLLILDLASMNKLTVMPVAAWELVSWK